MSRSPLEEKFRVFLQFFLGGSSKGFVYQSVRRIWTYSIFLETGILLSLHLVLFLSPTASRTLPWFGSGYAGFGEKGIVRGWGVLSGRLPF